uniref:Uncharacterized protein n=1 Tax=Rhizochromulina marina TaxID=1034831 RepID=A0A7S2W2L9_9STRA
MASQEQGVQLRAVGFCGVDDSVAPELLACVSARYPWVEWGVLLRQEKAGEPRFASQGWLQRLATVNQDDTMRLAAHLCSSHCEAVLAGDGSDLRRLHAEIGFRRFQINATKANNVDSAAVNAATCDRVRQVMLSLPEVEFIVQRNAETQELWKGLAQDPPSNMSFLFDDSVGRGVAAESWPSPDEGSPAFGYAGGLGPSNLADHLRRMAAPAAGRVVWVDMESSLRTKCVGPRSYVGA